MITVPWLVLERTDSPARAGLLAALVSLPGIVVSPVVGGLIDRVGRRAVSALSDVLSCLSVLLFVIGEAVSELTYVWIALIALLGAVFDPAGYTSRKSLIPNAAASAGMSVDKANGRHEGCFAIGWMLGPAIGAWCIDFGGPTLAFGGTSVLFMLAAFAVRSMRIRELRGEHHSSAEPFWEALRGGFSIMKSDKALLAFTLGLTGLSGLYMPIDTVIFPSYFNSLNDAPALGAVLSSIALGVVFGAFAYGRLATRFQTSTLLRIIIIVSTSALLPMGFLPRTWIFVLLALIVGVAWGPFNPLWNTVVQRRVPQESQGRIYGLQMSLMYSAPPVGQLMVGWGVESIGLRATFSIVLALFALTAATIVSLRSLNDL